MAAQAAVHPVKPGPAEMRALQQSYFENVGRKYGLGRGKVGARIEYAPLDRTEGLKRRTAGAEARAVEERERRSEAEKQAADAEKELKMERRRKERAEADAEAFYDDAVYSLGQTNDATAAQIAAEKTTKKTANELALEREARKAADQRAADAEQKSATEKAARKAADQRAADAEQKSATEKAARTTAEKRADNATTALDRMALKLDIESGHLDEERGKRAARRTRRQQRSDAGRRARMGAVRAPPRAQPRRRPRTAPETGPRRRLSQSSQPPPAHATADHRPPDRGGHAGDPNADRTHAARPPRAVNRGDETWKPRQPGPSPRAPRRERRRTR